MVELKTIYREIARLRWPNAARITGDGRFAVVVKCGHWPVVQLFADSKSAFENNRQPCGPGCKRNHAWLELKKPAPVWKPKPHWAAYLARD